SVLGSRGASGISRVVNPVSCAILPAHRLNLQSFHESLKHPSASTRQAARGAPVDTPILPATAPSVAPAAVRSAHPMTPLRDVCGVHGLRDLATRLAELEQWIGHELRDFERELAAVPRGVRAVQAAAHHLLDLGGKHLRPMCVALAAKIGDGFGPRARQLAVAVELVHTATLLHD